VISPRKYAVNAQDLSSGEKFCAHPTKQVPQRRLPAPQASADEERVTRSSSSSIGALFVERRKALASHQRERSCLRRTGDERGHLFGPSLHLGARTRSLVLLSARPHLREEDDFVIVGRDADEGQLAGRVFGLEIGDFEELGGERVALAGSSSKPGVLRKAHNG
jgi:hypothetical protein